MPVSWNAESDAMLFKAVLAVAPLAQLSTEQRNGIIAFMGQNGFPDVTWEGVRYVHTYTTRTEQGFASFLLSFFPPFHFHFCDSPCKFHGSHTRHYIHHAFYTMAPSRVLQNWNDDGLAWRVATALAATVRKEDWAGVMETLKSQGCNFTEGALR